MKNLIALVLLVLVAAGAWFYLGQDSDQSTMNPGQSENKTAGQTQAGATSGPSQTGLDQQSSSSNKGDSSNEDSEDEEFDEDFEDRPAAEVYKSADEAFAAIKKGAEDYDDLILEQFTTPGEDCNWCDDFYKTTTAAMFSKDASEDEKSYYAEVLAISGRSNNISTLIQAVQDAGKGDEADIYAEALELTIGDDKVVELLAQHINSENELLAEASVAAITNQGSRKAAETLYEHTVSVGDPDGFYSLGIGLAELIPEEETLPYLNELVTRRDPYSHLAVKSLLNYGMDGLRIVMESLTNSQDPAFDKKMLEDAVDHVSYEEPVEDYLKKLIKTSKNPLTVEFAKEILTDFEVEFEE